MEEKVGQADGRPEVQNMSENSKDRSPRFGRRVVWAIGIVLLMTLSFSAGVFVGFQKARFSFDWGERYERNFMGPEPRFMPMPPGGFEGDGFRNGHGLVGEVLSTAEGTIMIKDPFDRENTIKVTDKTIVHSRGDRVSAGDINVGDRIAVIGRPSGDGTVEARFIRVFDLEPNDN